MIEKTVSDQQALNKGGDEAFTKLSGILGKGVNFW